jgi:hypothetical protein
VAEDLAGAALVDCVELGLALGRQDIAQRGIGVGVVEPGDDHVEEAGHVAAAAGPEDQRQLRRRRTGHRAHQVEVGRPLGGELAGPQGAVAAL